VLESLASAFIPYTDKPFAFFGHSLGALLCFEFAHKLRTYYGQEPCHIFVSGRRAPHLPDTDRITYNLPASEFIDELRRLNGTPKEVLENPELMSLMMPALRADFEICQTYSYSEKAPLRCQITALGGLQDEDVSTEALQAWRDYTNGPFRMRVFAGDHFFLQTSESLLLQVVSQELRRLRPS
jgi:medium-chain acyl-[acyl-carrier-protein] hydrolase